MEDKLLRVSWKPDNQRVEFEIKEIATQQIRFSLTPTMEGATPWIIEIPREIAIHMMRAFIDKSDNKGEELTLSDECKIAHLAQLPEQQSNNEVTPIE